MTTFADLTPTQVIQLAETKGWPFPTNPPPEFNAALEAHNFLTSNFPPSQLDEMADKFVNPSTPPAPSPTPALKKLVTVAATFSKPGQTVTLDIPNLSSEAALRLHRFVKEEDGFSAKAAADELPGIALIMIADEKIKSTHPRYFRMIGTDALPPSFIKYIGTFPFGIGGPIVHVIEVGPPLPEAPITVTLDL